MTANLAPGAPHLTSARPMGAGSRLLCSAAALTALACVVSCQQTATPLANVSGKVTLDGRPLVGAVVSFQPQMRDGKPPGPGSVGRTDVEGRYALATVRGEPGATPGVHVVRIYSRSSENLAASDDESSEEERVPERYNYQSTLTFDVPPDGVQAADWTLVTEPVVVAP
ncbi:MAG: hypothetical protein KDA61_19605 [Planctomycetales bacterium]|nr:hypothetical protein [Planctomycetales bacterium]